MPSKATFWHGTSIVSLYWHGKEDLGIVLEQPLNQMNLRTNDSNIVQDGDNPNSQTARRFHE
jgi:hypothetical protein